MKKILLSIAVISIFCSMQLSALSLVHYWNFNSLSLRLTAAKDVVSSPITQIPADFTLSQASLVYQAIPSTASPYSTYCDSVPLAVGVGSPANMRNGDPVGLALRLRNPSDQMQLVLSIPTAGYKNIVISYDLQRSSAGNGALTNTFYYSVDNGTTWKNSTTNNGGLISKDTIQSSPNWAVKSVTITDPAANNNANLKFKILFTGGQNTGTSGNNRIDNITVEGTLLGETTAIQESEFNNAAINMLPNSTINGVVHFSEVVDAVVYNVQGRQIKAVTKATDLVTSDLSKGIYVVRINGLVSKKLIIE